MLMREARSAGRVELRMPTMAASRWVAPLEGRSPTAVEDAVNGVHDLGNVCKSEIRNPEFKIRNLSPSP
jgi:hypothetical protein